jgi:hypothetical protein
LQFFLLDNPFGYLNYQYAQIMAYGYNLQDHNYLCDSSRYDSGRWENVLYYFKLIKKYF